MVGTATNTASLKRGMGEMARCGVVVYGGGLDVRGHLCGNAAKYGEFCGVHSPEKKKEREANRGPTEFEKSCTRRKKERDHIATLESSHAELLEAVKVLLHFPSMHHAECQSVGVLALVKRLQKAIKNASEVE